jgi:hypothetical protein
VFDYRHPSYIAKVLATVAPQHLGHFIFYIKNEKEFIFVGYQITLPSDLIAYQLRPIT